MKGRPIILGALIVVYFLGVLLCTPLVRSWTQPPLKNQFDRLAVCQYKYFDQNGRIHGDLSHLPPELKGFVDDGKSGITWDPEKSTLNYVYAHSYPINVSPITFLTFGFIVPSSNTLGSSITPDMIKTNTPIFKKAGLLPAN